MRARHRVLAMTAVIVGSVSCAKLPGGPTPFHDAGVTHTAASTLLLLRDVRPMTRHLEAGHRLVRTRRGIESVMRPRRPEGWSPTGATNIQITLPTRSTDATHIGIAGRTDAWIDVFDDDVSEVPVTLTGSAAVFVAAARATDIVHVIEDARVEEFRLVRERAPSVTARWRVRGGPDVADVTLVERGLEVHDRAGRLVFRSDPIVGVDADGAEVAATLTIAREGSDYVVTATFDTASRKFPFVVDPGWVGLGAMSTERYGHTATLMADGRVLFVGGTASATLTTPLSSCEIYDPRTDTWTAAAPLVTARYGHSAIVATWNTVSGVLVVGGRTPAVTGTAAFYSPTTDQWFDAGTGVPRADFPLVSSGGFVFAIGGATDLGATASIQRWNAGWSNAGSFPNSILSVKIREHFCVTLTGGSILVVGGKVQQDFGGTTISGKTWRGVPPSSFSPTDDLAFQTLPKTAVPLPDGGALIPGSNSQRYSSSAGWTAVPGGVGQAYGAVVLRDGRILSAGGGGRQLIDPVTLVASAAGGASGSRQTVTLLANGNVLVAGGSAAPELYRPLQKAWTPGPVLGTPRVGHTATTLASGEVVVAGGRLSSTSQLSTSERFAASGARLGTPTMLVAREDHTATALTDGRLLVAGGRSVSSPSSTAETFDRTTNSWTATASMSAGRYLHVATVLRDARVFVYGGIGSPETGEIFDPALGTWTGTAPASPRWHQAMAVTLADGRVLVAGGRSSATTLSSTAEIYDPQANSWTTVPPMSATRSGGLMRLLATGKVAVAGGPGRTTGEVFDPTTSQWSPASALNVAGRGVGELLGSGQILLAGGSGTDTATATSSAELFDPLTGLSRSTAPMLAAREGHAIAALSGGRLLVVGGQSSSTVLASTEIYTPISVAAECGADGDCLTGHCVDSVCCDSACPGSCNSCDLLGSRGRCVPVPSGAPTGSRSCAPYTACVAGACATNCGVDTDCVATSFCDAGVCAPKKATGVACDRTTECTSGFCVDGICCDVACTEQCAACNVPNKLGTCSAATGAPRGGRPACNGTSASACSPSCGGTDATKCVFPGAAVACGAAKCEGGTAVHVGTCDGTGVCVDVPTSCGAYACGPTACNTMCSSKAECAAGHVCTGGACVPVVGLGDACTDPGGCSAGLFCTEGVCCGVAACDPGSSCATKKPNGTCVKLPGTTCTGPFQCASGFCVDGVCCDAACDGQCEACDVADRAGLCSAVSGTPHGMRNVCPSGDATCGARRCDGAKDRTSCVGFVNDGTVKCAEARCEGDQLVPVAHCDGAGACAARGAAPCSGGFRCVGGRCPTTCAINQDCAKDFACKDGLCQAVAADCSADWTAVVTREGTRLECAPYICAAAACLARCAATNECSAGLTCTSAGECTAPEVVEPGDSCGFGVGRSAGTRSAGLALSALVSLALLRRRASQRLHRAA